LDDADKRVQLLLDVMNNGLVDARLVPVLQQLAQAIQARNQQGALQLHVQLVTMATGDVATALVGVKFLIAKLYS
jgi:protein transport protein SEC31